MAQPASPLRRRRDGRPVETIPPEARRQEPPPPPAPVPPAAALGPVAGFLGGAASAGAADAAAAGAVSVAGASAAQAVAMSAAVIMSAFERFLDQRAYVVEADVGEVLDLEYGDAVPEVTLLEAAGEEIDFDRSFRGKVRERLDRDLPKVLAIDDLAVREAELQKVLDRERRYAEAREEAIAVRALGNIEARLVREASPEGAYWQLSPYVENHTRDCLAMAGKVWPWTVLEAYRPPLHVGCGCRLVPVALAQDRDLPGSARMAHPEMAFHAMQVQEATWDPGELEEELSVLEGMVLEAARGGQERWGSGHTKGGQFKPRRGGTPGRPTGKRMMKRRRRRADLLPVVKPAGIDKVERTKLASKLAAGDEVFLDGEWARVEHAHEKPGVLDLEGVGMVYVDPDREVRVRVVDEGSSDPRGQDGPFLRDPEAVGLSGPDALEPGQGMIRQKGKKWEHFFRNDFGDLQTRTSAHQYTHVLTHIGHEEDSTIERALAKLEHLKGEPERYAASKAYYEDRVGRYGKRQAVSWHGSADAAEKARRGLEARGYRGVKAVELLQEAKPDEGKPQEPEKPKGGVEPAPTALEGGELEWGELEGLLSGKAPKDAGPLATGFAYQGPGAGADGKRRRAYEDDGILHLPEGFFKQSKKVRESVVMRHLGRRLSRDLDGPQVRELEQAGLPGAVPESYLTLNGDGWDRAIDLHPEGMRLLAGHAKGKGYPLRPQVEEWLADHEDGSRGEVADAAGLAERVEGMTYQEAWSHLSEAGYGEAVGTPPDDDPRTWRNYETGTALRFTFADAKGTMKDVEVLELGRASTVSAGETEDAIAAAMETDAETTWGPSTVYVSHAGRWVTWKSADGKGRAVKFALGDGKATGEERSFDATPAEVRQVRRVELGRDPHGMIREGDDYGALMQELGPWTGWQASPQHTVTRGEGGNAELDARGHGPDVEAVYTWRKVVGDGIEELRIAVGHNPDGKPTYPVRSVGYPGAGDAEIVSKAAYDDRKAKEREALEAAKKRAQAAAAEKWSGLLEALEAKDPKKPPPVKGLPLNDTLLYLRDKQGWQIRTRRRNRKDGTISYGLRSPTGDTLTVAGGMYRGMDSITKVTWKPAKKVESKERIRGKRPASLEAWEGDAHGRVDELGERFGSPTNVSTFIYGNKRGHSAHHEFNGTIVLGKAIKPSLDRYFKAHAAGKDLTDDNLLDFYSALQTVQHEINHGVQAEGDGGPERGKTFGPSHYQGSGKGWEEWVTEETAHLLTVDWLESWGASDVLEAVSRNPNDTRVLGTYRKYRTSGAAALEAAGVNDAEERKRLLYRWKFQATPLMRERELGELLMKPGTPYRESRAFKVRGGENRDARTHGLWSIASKDEYMAGRDFTPTVRPELGRWRPREASWEELKKDSVVHVDIAGFSVDVRLIEKSGSRWRVKFADGSGHEGEYISEQDVVRYYPPAPKGGWKTANGVRGDEPVLVGIWNFGENRDVPTAGRSLEVSQGGNYVKVELEDGTALWYAAARVRKAGR